jgi:hypothetical protein
MQLTSAARYRYYRNSYRLTGFDISGLTLPFKARALRFVGADTKGPWGGTELYTVRARVSR